jgi:aromatic-amino-acid transaminase
MLGASIIEELVLNEQYRLSYEEEIKYVCSMLEARSLAFLEEAKKVGLATLPYERGFFICVPCSQPKEMAAQLQNDKVHLVPTKECLRIALCSVSKEEATRLPKIIKNRLDSIEK